PGTALFDVVHREWSSQMIEALALDASILPKCHESAEETGAISSSIAGLTGLAPGTPVVGGGGDQAASAVGNGIVELGVVSCTLGTSGVVFAHMDQVTYDPLGRVHTFCHAVPGKWHVMGVTQGAGLSLQWFRNQLSPGSDHEALMSAAQESLVGAQGCAYGAALLALVGTGAYASVPEVCRSVIRETGSVTPRAWESEFYQNGHGVYRAIYPALKPVTQMISHL